MSSQGDQLLRVGALAKATGKSVRAIRLYEELELLRPASRTSGGFRQFTREAIDRVRWISKLQAIGLTLAEIRALIHDFEAAENRWEATGRVRDLFRRKLGKTREQIAGLQRLERELSDAVAYLESCRLCNEAIATECCDVCDRNGHEPSRAPDLFTGLSRSAVNDQAADVAVGSLIAGSEHR